MSEANGDDGDAAAGAGGDEPPARPPRPVPLVLSVVFGVLGLALLVPGLALGNTPLSLAGFVAGALSLGAALYWRSLLVSAWAAQKAQRQGRRR